MNRLSVVVPIVTLLFGLILSNCSGSGNSSNVRSLEVEHLTNPIGIDKENPRFSWIYDDEARGAAQSAYRIIVSGSEENLKNEQGDLWDSGKINSSNSVNIRYEGDELESTEKYYWKVRIWDQNGEPASWSEVQHFQMGLLNEDDWQAQWITTPDSTVSSPLFRNEFSIDKEIESATAFVTGAGYYEFYLNGEKVGDHVLDPAMTDFRKRILYETYDVTGQLNEGENAWGLWLGNGAFRLKAEEGRWTWYGMNNQFGTPMGIVQLHIQYEDGSNEIIGSNGDWKTDASPIIYNNVYGGEDYDARLEQAGWNTVGFDDSAWQSVEVVDDPDVIMDSQVMPPIRVIETIEPVTQANPGSGTYLYDLEQNIPGWWRLQVEGERGTEIKIRGAETLNNELFPKPLKEGDSLSTKHQYHANVWTTYTLKGEGIETYEPRFFYSGFRYIEVQVDHPEAIESLNIEGRVVHSDLKRTSSFSSSNTLLNQICEAAVWSQRGNLHGYPEDCPHREKGGYNGDGQVIAETSIHDFDMHALYAKWLNDMKDSQYENGRIPNTSPLMLGGVGGGIAWGSAYILLPWWMYQYYEDADLLEEHYESMKDYMAYLENLASENDENPDEEFIINEFGGYWDSLGEWEAPVHERTGPINPLTNTYYWYLNSLTFAKIAGVLGKDEERAEYLALADTIKNAFNEKFFLPELNLYGTEKPDQGYLLFALSGDMVPEDRRQAVLDHLIHDIQVTSDGHLGTGILGTKHLINFLAEEGREDVIHEAVTKTTFPSWGYWIENGATTLWESWDAESSHNHQMFGTVNEYLYKYLAGIRSPMNDGTSTGYKEIHIKPYIPDDMDWAEASVETVRGTISSRWEKSENNLTLEITIPANTTGKVSIPKLDWSEVQVSEGGDTVWIDGEIVENDAQISGGREGDRFIELDIMSGIYEFEVTGEE
ncbi:MAG: family 78 glycoside hydrolase catalytic domain [Balneolaceae bacterium]|nr:family 78 glycoside hydrolase catalytic domain [Balneolaceae bacterium]